MKSFQLNTHNPKYRAINKKTYVQDLPDNTTILGVDKNTLGQTLVIKISEDGRHTCNGEVCSRLCLDNDLYAYIPICSLPDEDVFEAKLSGDWTSVAVCAAQLYFRH